MRPCIESIPHLSELASKHPSIVFLGVSVLEESTDDHIKSFVDKMGEKMAYRVAYSGNKDGMAETWLKPAFQDGIPTSFVVKGGSIQWIGHPNDLDDVLERITKGTFDLVASQRSFEAQLEATKARMAADAAFLAAVALREKGMQQDAERALDQAVEKYPRLKMSSERLRYEWLAEDDPQAWLIQTEKLAETGKPENWQRIVSFALRSSQKKEGVDRARTAIAIALRASAQNDWDVLLYARTIYLKLGDDKEALEITNRMLDLFPQQSGERQCRVKRGVPKEPKRSRSQDESQAIGNDSLRSVTLRRKTRSSPNPVVMVNEHEFQSPILSCCSASGFFGYKVLLRALRRR